MIAINEVPSPFDKEMEEDSDEEEGPATQPGHAGTGANGLCTDVRITCCIPSFSHYSESEHSRRTPLNLKNIDQHGGNLKFNLVQVS